jgi:hypothetical protein
MAPASTVRGLGCLFFFLLPFAGIGVFTALQALQHAAAGSWKEALFLGLFGLTFGAVGIGGIAAALAGSRKLKEQAALESRHPDRPWLWRHDWASGRIQDSGRRSVVFAWIFAVFWNLVSLPAGYLGVQTALEKGEHAALLGLLFPIVGAGLLVWAIRASIRFKKYGSSHLQLSTIPGVVGRTLAGTVSVPGALVAAGDFLSTLSCVHQVTTGSGKSRSTSEDVLWQEERRVQGVASRNPTGMVTNVPITFRIPSDLRPSDSSNTRDTVVWQLRVSAEMPGVDYDSTFEVPVFHTAASGEPLTREEEQLTRDPLADLPYQQPPGSRILVTNNRRGTEILFPAARNPGVAVGSTLFLLIWCGAIVLQVYFDVPTVFPVIFGLFGSLILIGVLDLWMEVSRVTIDAGTLTVATGYLYPGKERSLPGSEVAEVAAMIGMRSGRTPYYDIVVRRKNGKKIRAGRSIRDKREAEWLAGTIRNALGLSPGRGSEIPARDDSPHVAG